MDRLLVASQVFGRIWRPGVTGATSWPIKLQLFAHVSRWLENKGLGPQHLTGERVAEFLCARRSAGYTLWLRKKGVAPLLMYLRSVGVAPALKAPDGAPSPI